MTLQGTPVRYLPSTFLPGEEEVFGLFEGPTEQSIKDADGRAEIPFQRVVEALHIASEDLG